MYALKRERDADIVVNILPQVQLIRVRCITLLEGGLHRNHQILETSVASDGHAARYHAGGIRGQPVVVHVSRHFQIGIEDFLIPEYLKELRSGMPRKMAFSGCQTCQFNYKGLQS